MNLDSYNAFCATLKATSKVIQWGGAHVWKVGGKVFAIAHEREAEAFAVTFKVMPLSYDVMKDQPGLRPAPYLASRGMKWIQHFEAPGLNDDDLKLYIEKSHQLVAGGLSKTKQRELGLIK